MNSKKNRKGFTLMEMLIVVAIIAILVAIMIPTFTNQLEKARQATDLANIRAAYAEAMVNAMSTDGEETASATSEKMTQNNGSWSKVTWPEYLKTAPTVEKGKTVTVEVNIEDDSVTYKVND